MTSHEGLTIIESLMPAILGGTLVLLALVGSRELLKEASVALKKRASA